uniref:Uncharacterized protein n=1 Tax=Globodera rostochiensis TaxID=31243 RepID=A0A914HK72_GLORO
MPSPNPSFTKIDFFSSAQQLVQFSSAQQLVQFSSAQLIGSFLRHNKIGSIFFGTTNWFNFLRHIQSNKYRSF